MEPLLVRYIITGCIVGVAWIIFSAIIVTILCMNSARLSRLDEPFKTPEQIIWELKEKTNDV